MNIKLNTGMVRFFSGTYGTDWEVSETDDEGNELVVDYTMADLMKSIQSVYQDRAESIVKDWNIDWIKKIKLTGTYSPREYNFKTDELDFTLTIDKRGFMEAVRELEHNEEFAKFLHDNYASRDGFISFTPDNYKEMWEEITTNGDHSDQAIASVINFFTKDKNEDIEIWAYEEWSCNGYGGLDYTVEK